MHAYTQPIESIVFGALALISSSLLALLTLRWLRLEFFWARAQALLIPSQSNKEYSQTVKNDLNHVLSKKVFRYEMKNVLNKKGIFKLFMDNGKPVIQLDIAFRNPWNNHNYLRSALGWIATCMPTEMACQTLERKDTRLVFRFGYMDINKTDTQGMYAAVEAWRKNMQCLLVLHLDQCSLQHLNCIPQKINNRHRATNLPLAPSNAFEKNVLLTKEHVCLHIGFNGSTYYTYFEDGVTTQIHGRREYQSWEALWSVWQHMNEVQEIFKQQPSNTTAIAPKKSCSFDQISR